MTGRWGEWSEWSGVMPSVEMAPDNAYIVVKIVPVDLQIVIGA